MEYDIIETSNKESMVGKINMAIRDGWEPIGGIATDSTGNYLYYFQAIIRNTKKRT